MSKVQVQSDHALRTEEKAGIQPAAGALDVSVKEPPILSDTLSSQTASERPCQITGFAWFLLVVSIISSVFLFSLDTTIVADIQPALIHDLGQIEKLPWISVALAVSATATCLLWGKLFGLFNIKLLFIVSAIIFEAGSALCGAAPNMDALIVGRAICGVGAMGIYIGAMNILSVLTTLQERPKVIGYMALMWGIGTVLGPILGGAFVNSSATWRWSFYINLCVGAAVSPAWIFLLPSHHPRPDLTHRDRIASIDWVGVILYLGASLSASMAISFGGALYAWGSGQIIGLFVCGGVLYILFAIQQGIPIMTSREDQIFPWDFVTNWEMCVFFAVTAAANTASYVPIYFTPLYFQFAHNTSALQAGVYLLPYVAFFVTAILSNGLLVSKTGLYMPWYFVGGIMTIIGGALLYTIALDDVPARTYGFSILLALGGGAYNQTAYSIAQMKVAKERVPHAVSFIMCAQMTGIVLTLVISNASFLNQATDRISSLLPTASRPAVQQAVSGVNGALFGSLDDATRRAVLEAIVAAIDDTYIMVIAAGCIVVISSLFMKRERLFGRETAST